MGCIHLCGGPQGLMQCVAWAGMLVSYSQEGTVAEAVEKTFDGEHPCPLCLAIEKSKEKQPSSGVPNRTPSGGDVLKHCKDMLPLELCTVPLMPACHERAEKPGGADETGRRRNTEPPSPPPRDAVIV